MPTAFGLLGTACLLGASTVFFGCVAPFPSEDFIRLPEASRTTGRTEAEIREAVLAGQIRAFTQGPMRKPVTGSTPSPQVILSRSDLERWTGASTAAPTVEAPSRGPAVGRPAVAPRGSRPQPRSYALLVGVRRYDPNELRDLPYSEPDVAELARTLIDSGYSADNVVLLTQTVGAEQPRFAPTGENIRRELRLLLADRSAEDTVLIAFAGHGVQFRNNDESWFCPADARLADRSTLISLTELYRELAACRAGSKVLLIDACRNEPQTDNSRSRAEVEVGYFTRAQEREPPPQTAALFSCSAGERAFEHSDLKHGVFFHFVIEGLAGKARTGADRLTVGDLENYVRRSVSDFVRARYAVRQMPELAGRSAAGAALVAWDK